MHNFLLTMHYIITGLFVDSIIEVAKRELAWECDYVREAECTYRFRKLVEPHSQYYVPEVIPLLCSQQVGLVMCLVSQRKHKIMYM